MDCKAWIKITAGLILILLIFPPSLFSGENQFKWQVGKELTYKVNWAFIRLGTLKLVVYDTLTTNNNLVYHVKLFIDSNPLLFFVNMHNVYESFITKDFRLQLFQSVEKIDDITYNSEYRFDYADSLINIKMTDMNNPQNIISRKDTLDEILLDGTSLIFYARAHVNLAGTDTVTSFFESKRGKVVINFKGKKRSVNIDALSASCDSYFVDGVVLTKGIAGITGPYKGWFSTGLQKTPLKAELKVFIGSVKIELEEWKKWKPEFAN